MRAPPALAWASLCALTLVGCSSHSAKCGPESCLGCCDLAGRCQPGTADQLCGIGGGACIACGAQVCNADLGVCREPSPDSGTDAGGPDSGTSDAGNGVDAGNGPCTGFALGIYCGARLGLDPSIRFECSGAPDPTQLETCGEGCNATAVGTNDQCFQANCQGQISGYYCGSDNVNGNPGLLYLCQANAVASFSSCPNGCLTEPPGTDDRCAAAAPGAPTDVRAAPGNGLAWVRWTAQSIPQTGFTISALPGGATVAAPPSATLAQFPGLTNGTTYTFTVTPDTGPTSNPSNAVTPSTQSNVVADVPEYPQQQSLTCEEASLSMALAHQGISRTETEVLNDIGIDWTPSQVDGGTLYWGDPYTRFVGNPAGSEVARTGYGTYFPNIVRAATDFGANVLDAGEGLVAQDIYAALLAGHPVEVWIGYDWNYHPQSMNWIADDGRQLGWHGPYEHAIVLVGVTPNSVIVNNPAHKLPWDFVSRTAFETTWATYGNMAVILR